jgi:hypothetical protein
MHIEIPSCNQYKACIDKTSAKIGKGLDFYLKQIKLGAIFNSPSHYFTIKRLKPIDIVNLHLMKVLIHVLLGPKVGNMILFDFTFKNATNSTTFYIFCPLGLSCSFLTSCLNNAPTPSTSPLPWLVAKKFYII